MTPQHPPTRICFIRHGETDWNVKLQCQGHTDIPLNDTGLEQARALGQHFQGTSVAAIYCSDLLRTRQTAQPIASATQHELITHTALRERNFGRCEGLTHASITDRFSEDMVGITGIDPEYVLPEGESRRDVQDRVLPFISRLIQRHAGESIVVVTHGGVLDVIYRRAMSLPLNAPRTYPIPNTGLNRVTIQGNHWMIEKWGDIPHLSDTAGR